MAEAEFEHILALPIGQQADNGLRLFEGHVRQTLDGILHGLEIHLAPRQLELSGHQNGHSALKTCKVCQRRQRLSKSNNCSTSAIVENRIRQNSSRDIHIAVTTKT